MARRSGMHRNLEWRTHREERGWFPSFSEGEASCFPSISSSSSAAEHYPHGLLSIHGFRPRTIESPLIVAARPDRHTRGPSRPPTAHKSRSEHHSRDGNDCTSCLARRLRLVDYKKTSRLISRADVGNGSSKFFKTMGCSMPKVPMRCALVPASRQ